MSADDIDTAIAQATGRPFRRRRAAPVGGGDINRTMRLEGDESSFFVKLNRAGELAMFEAEAKALTELRRCASLHVPEPVCWGSDGEHAYLVLEYVDLHPLAGASQRRLGEGMAELHGITASRFGWDADNTIGTTPQPNGWHARWVGFWRDCRLGHQLALARARGDRALNHAGDDLLAHLDTLLADHRPVPSLLHGDLWAGNAAADDQGHPVIFDPASFYGDRETDLAMMELFGGFGAALEAYRAAWPVDRGYEVVRRDLYQLYHLLNHFNLFGGGYGRRARQVAERLVARAG